MISFFSFQFFSLLRWMNATTIFSHSCTPETTQSTNNDRSLPFYCRCYWWIITSSPIWMQRIGTKHRLGGKIQRSVDRVKRFGRSERGGGGRGKIVRARMLRCVMKKAHIIQLWIRDSHSISNFEEILYENGKRW